MELRHLVLAGGLGAVDLELLIQAVIHDERVGHADTMRFHRMTGVVSVVADIAVVEIRHFLGLGGRGIDASARRVERCVAALARHGGWY